MRPSRNLALVLAAACAVTLAGCGKKPPAEPPAEKGAAYVALGDSFTAVAGRVAPAEEICQRSSADYPALVAKALKLTLANVSCGGAQPDELTQAQIVSNGVNQPQLNAITPDTRVVTLGIGLNETITGNGGSTKMSYLLTDVCAPKNRESDNCETYLKVTDADWTKVIDALGDEIGDSLDLVKERAPQARIVFVGYPRVLPETGPCDRVDLPTVAFDRLRSTMADVNRVLKKTAADAGVEYVDMYAASAGHDACAADPWVNGTEKTSKAFAYHPLTSYHRAVAEKLEALLGTKKPQA